MALRLQERFERAPAGRALISAFLVVTLAAVAVTNLPESRLRREGLKAAQPYLEATGLDQNWRVFAPHPRRTSLRLLARVRYRDGAVGVWRLPAGGDLVGAYWDYRWRKWLENVIQDSRRKDLQRAAAAYIAREMRRPGKIPARVTLVERAQDLRPPGSRGPDAGPWKQYVLLSTRVGDSGRAADARP